MQATETRALPTRLACALALLFAMGSAQALQVIDASDGASVEAILSIQEPTRIRIEGSPITDVFGNIYSSGCAALPTPAALPVGASPAVGTPASAPSSSAISTMPHLGGDVPDDAALLHILNPASPRAILVRTLRNLHGLYAEREEWDRAARSADRVLKLTPDQPDALRDRGLAYLKMDYKAGAQRDLARYLHLSPEANDAPAMREQLVELSAVRTSRMH